MKHNIIFGAGLFILSIVIFVIGSLGPDVGPGALPFLAIEITGILAVGIDAMVLIVIAGCGSIRRFAKNKNKPKISVILREFFQFLLSCLVYCGGSFLVLASISSFDIKTRTLFTRGVFIAIGILSLGFMVWFRRYRKMHPKKIEHISGFLVMLIPLAFAITFLWGGVHEGIKYTKDMLASFPIEEVILEDVNAIRIDKRRTLTAYYLKGTAEDGGERSFHIDSPTYKTWKEYCEQDETITVCVYYYKNTKVVYEISPF